MSKKIDPLKTLRKCKFTKNENRYTHLIQTILYASKKETWKKFKMKNGNAVYWWKLEKILRSIDGSIKGERYKHFIIQNMEVPYDGYSKKNGKDIIKEDVVIYKYEIDETSCQWFIIVREKHIDDIVDYYFHNPLFGYRGRDAIWRKLSHSYIGISREDVANVIKGQAIKQITGGNEANIEPRYKQKPSKPNEYWQTDITTFKRTVGDTQYKLLVIVDLFSKFAWTYTIPTKQTVNPIGGKLEDLIMKEGAPKMLGCDNEFTSNQIKDVCAKFGILLKPGTPYKSNDQAEVERLHRTIKDPIVSYLWNNKPTKKGWSNYVQYFTYNYNTTAHASLDNKCCPMHIHRGTDVNLCLNKMTTKITFEEDKIKDLFTKAYTKDIENLTQQFTHVKDKELIKTWWEDRRITPKCITIPYVSLNNNTISNDKNNNNFETSKACFPKGSVVCYIINDETIANAKITSIVQHENKQSYHYKYKLQIWDEKKGFPKKYSNAIETKSDDFHAIVLKTLNTVVFEDNKTLEYAEMEYPDISKKIYSYPAFTYGQTYFFQHKKEAEIINFQISTSEIVNYKNVILYFNINSIIYFNINSDIKTVNLHDVVYIKDEKVGYIYHKTEEKVYIRVSTNKEALQKALQSPSTLSQKDNKEKSITLLIKRPKFSSSVGTKFAQTTICQSIVGLKKYYDNTSSNEYTTIQDILKRGKKAADWRRNTQVLVDRPVYQYDNKNNERNMCYLKINKEITPVQLLSTKSPVNIGDIIDTNWPKLGIFKNLTVIKMDTKKSQKCTVVQNIDDNNWDGENYTGNKKQWGVFINKESENLANENEFRFSYPKPPSAAVPSESGIIIFRDIWSKQYVVMPLIKFMSTLFQTLTEITDKKQMNRKGEKYITRSKTNTFPLVEPLINLFITEKQINNISKINLLEIECFKKNQKNQMSFDTLLYFVENVKKWWEENVKIPSKKINGSAMIPPKKINGSARIPPKKINGSARIPKSHTGAARIPQSNSPKGSVIAYPSKHIENINKINNNYIKHQLQITYKLLKSNLLPPVNDESKITITRRKGIISAINFLLSDKSCNTLKKKLRRGDLIVINKHTSLGYISYTQNIGINTVNIFLKPNQVDSIQNNIFSKQTDDILKGKIKNSKLFIIKSTRLKENDIIRVKNTARHEVSKKLNGKRKDLHPYTVRDAFLRKEKNSLKEADKYKLDPYNIRPKWSNDIYVIINVGCMYKFIEKKAKNIETNAKYIFIKNTYLNKKNKIYLLGGAANITSKLKRYLKSILEKKQFLPDKDFNQKFYQRYQVSRISDRFLHANGFTGSKIDIGELKKKVKKLRNKIKPLLKYARRKDEATSLTDTELTSAFNAAEEAPNILDEQLPVMKYYRQHQPDNEKKYIVNLYRKDLFKINNKTIWRRKES